MHRQYLTTYLHGKIRLDSVPMNQAWNMFRNKKIRSPRRTNQLWCITRHEVELRREELRSSQVLHAFNEPPTIDIEPPLCFHIYMRWCDSSELIPREVAIRSLGAITVRYDKNESHEIRVSRCTGNR